MNLLDEKWLPVRRRTGQIDWVAPHQIAEPDIVAFAAHRADFNGALAQMMIGLLQTTTPVDDESDWKNLLDTPPSEKMLREWFQTVTEAFVFDGDKARFMQDIELVEGTANVVDALLIDAAGGQTINNNTDHFVKRETVQKICPHCAATALLTLQINAPAGGAGHRTGLRGGGPLTTLVVATPTRSLWQDLWLNVQPREIFLIGSESAQKKEKNLIFPWLADISHIQKKGGETQPLQTHPFHVFWAMPRRIRLDFSDVHTGQCDLCQRDSVQLISRYITRPQGLNYKGVWRHPFSPYYKNKEDWLPVHPQPGGFTYKHWLVWVMSDDPDGQQKISAASIVKYVLSKHRQKSALRLWIFGYDMDNMKPRCWYETMFPLYDLAASDDKAQGQLREVVAMLIKASEQAAFYLRQAVKHAWFGGSEARGEFSFIDQNFWDSTALPFYQKLKDLIEQARSEFGIDMEDTKRMNDIGEAWLKVLRDRVLYLFDNDIVGTSPIDQQDPRRIAEAYNMLRGSLNGKVIREILYLPPLHGKKVIKTQKGKAPKKDVALIEEK